VLLDLSIILTLLVVGSSFTNEVPKRVEAAYPQSTRRELPEGMSITPKKVSGATPLLRGGREDLLLQGPSALTNKVLLIELSRAALMRTLHERSVDRR
jgi:hypothetical protein